MPDGFMASLCFCVISLIHVRPVLKSLGMTASSLDTGQGRFVEASYKTWRSDGQDVGGWNASLKVGSSGQLWRAQFCLVGVPFLRQELVFAR